MSAPARPILRSSVLMAGTGAPLLLLHGSASAAVMWSPVIDALKSRFRVIAPDLIGYGRTEAWVDDCDFSAEDELRLLEPLLPGGAPVPVKVGVWTVVILSVLLLPVSDSGARSGIGRSWTSTTWGAW